jgi:diaminohydroxyphosphoribosylaminopyrimidine deaminase/5-amino-6-(5-phosphoribosylamino)uracil reductase
MTGVGTVLADDPSLTVRDPAVDTQGRQPLRVLLDARLRTPPSARMLGLPGDTLIYCIEDNGRQPLVDAGADIVKVDAGSGGVDLRQVLEDLARRQINDVLVEAGPGLAGAIIGQNLADELVIYQAPHMMGSETLGMLQTPQWTKLADRQAVTITDSRRIGDDNRITAQLAERS